MILFYTFHFLQSDLIYQQPNFLLCCIDDTHRFSKALPVSVPNATHENDLLCQIHWNISIFKELNTSHLQQSIQSIIAQFGITYILEEREITVSQNSEGYTVAISGLWDRKSAQYSMITAGIENFSDSEVQGEPAMYR